MATTNFFTFTDQELEDARDVLDKNGVTDPLKQDERMQLAQETGKISILGYGSLLHTAHTDKEMKTTKAHVNDMSSKFRHAWNYYGGEAGRSTLMQAMEKDEGAVTHGLIQEVEIKSAKGFIEYYDDLQVRENPVNSPVYSFNETVEAITENGETVTCLTCLSDTEGPLYVGDELTEYEQALIIAHGMGPDQRLDNGAFRQEAGAELDNVEFLDLQDHQKTGAAYVYAYQASREAHGFPKDEYLERLIDNINTIRSDMYPEGKDILEGAENGGQRSEFFVPRDRGLSGEFSSKTQVNIFQEYIAANDKLQDILMDNKAYQNWDREWAAPDPYEKYGQD